MKWILNLYPRTWQARYREELELHLDLQLEESPQASPERVQLALDLLSGAFDAWKHPEYLETIIEREGLAMSIKSHPWEILDQSPREAFKRAGSLLGLTLLLTSVGVALDKTFGPHLMTQALLHSAAFIAAAVAFRQLVFDNTSETTNRLWAAGSAVGLYLLALGIGSIVSWI